MKAHVYIDHVFVLTVVAMRSETEAEFLERVKASIVVALEEDRS